MIRGNPSIMIAPSLSPGSTWPFVHPFVRSFVQDPRELLILSLKREVRLLRMENVYLKQLAQLSGNGGNGQVNGNGNQAMAMALGPSKIPAAAMVTTADSRTPAQSNPMLTKYIRENEILRYDGHSWDC